MDPNLKIPVGLGMKAFFQDPASQGINSSLQFFPLGTDLTSTCNASYATPKVVLSKGFARAPRLERGRGVRNRLLLLEPAGHRTL